LLTWVTISGNSCEKNTVCGGEVVEEQRIHCDQQKPKF
jgi:hypothetical protein